MVHLGNGTSGVAPACQHFICLLSSVTRTIYGIEAILAELGIVTHDLGALKQLAKATALMLML
jgi:hypothetical protein